MGPTKRKVSRSVIRRLGRRVRGRLEPRHAVASARVYERVERDVQVPSCSAGQANLTKKPERRLAVWAAANEAHALPSPQASPLLHQPTITGSSKARVVGAHHRLQSPHCPYTSYPDQRLLHRFSGRWLRSVAWLLYASKVTAGFEVFSPRVFVYPNT